MSTNTKLVKTYAKSLFQNLISSKEVKKENYSFTPANITSKQENKISANIFIIGEELLIIRSLLISSKKLKTVFKNPTYQEQQKLNILLEIFPGLTITMKSFLKILTERNHLSLLPQISDAFEELLLKFKRITKIKILVASPLSANFRVNLLKSLQLVTSSKDIILNIGYDPKLLGGLILEYNSCSIDASILKEFSSLFNNI